MVILLWLEYLPSLGCMDRGPWRVAIPRAGLGLRCSGGAIRCSNTVRDDVRRQFSASIVSGLHEISLVVPFSLGSLGVEVVIPFGVRAARWLLWWLRY